MADAAASWIGRVIDGRYAIESLLGAGGMGVVLRARHKFTGGLVAVKMLHADLNLDPQLEARFLAEARASNAIGHPAIVKVLDAGRTPEGELYLVMELLAGQPMRLAVSRGLGQPAIRRIGLELLDALAAAHARGFIHRDLKPENVFLAEPNGVVKLLDFGIAKVLAADVGAKPGTQAGVVLGTIAYMAPEQLRDAASVDARADLWAMGVMLYEMLAGRLPYRGTTVEEIFVKLASDEPDPIRMWIPTIAPEIDRFFARALARDPAARFGSAIEMAGLLAQLPLMLPQAPTPRAAADSSPNATMATGYSGTMPHGAAGRPTPLPLAVAAPSAHSTPLPIAAGYSPPPTPPAPNVAPNRSRTVGIVLGLAAVGVIGAAIVVAKTRGGSRAPSGGRTDLVMGSAVTPPPPLPDAAPVQLDAAIVVPAPQPAPAPPAPHIKTTPKPTPAPAPPKPAPAPTPGPQPQQPYPDVQQPPADLCATNCMFASNTCGLASSANCLASCRKNPTLNQCAPAAHGDCNALAHCFLANACGAGVANGTGTCSEAISCQISQCRFNDTTCGCRCVANLASNHSAALFALDSCIVECNANQQCMQNNCVGVRNRCMAQ